MKAARRIAQVIGGCITLAALAGSVYFAAEAWRVHRRVSNEKAAVLFRLPVDISKEGRYEVPFHAEPSLAHGAVLAIEAEGNAASPTELAEIVSRSTGGYRLQDASGDTIWEANFSPAEPMESGSLGGPTWMILSRTLNPHAGDYRFLLHITTPAPVGQPGVVFSARYFHCGLEQLFILIPVALLAASLVVAAIAGTLTGRSVWRSRRRTGAP